MSIEGVRKYYGVPARRGGRVEYMGERGKPQYGTICGARGSHLSIRLDGCKHSRRFHPTWKIRYLNEGATSGAGASALTSKK